jgi:hypothetical protein
MPFAVASELMGFPGAARHASFLLHVLHFLSRKETMLRHLLHTLAGASPEVISALQLTRLSPR